MRIHNKKDKGRQLEDFRSIYISCYTLIDQTSEEVVQNTN